MKYYCNVLKIKHLMIDQKISVKELADKIGFNHSYLISVLNGKRHVPKRTSLLIANALNVEVSDIFHSKEKVK
ncbi:hypothetical protein BU032_12380 [Staphylococcus simulans]|nr:hypothetical protein BU032_12380 [Staphylococcus simulans]